MTRFREGYNDGDYDDYGGKCTHHCLYTLEFLSDILPWGQQSAEPCTHRMNIRLYFKFKRKEFKVNSKSTLPKQSERSIVTCRALASQCRAQTWLPWPQIQRNKIRYAIGNIPRRDWRVAVFCEIVVSNYAGNNEKSWHIMKMQILAT
jgi:hypothetical protein